MTKNSKALKNYRAGIGISRGDMLRALVTTGQNIQVKNPALDIQAAIYLPTRRPKIR